MKENTRGASLNRELTAFGPVPSVRLGRSLGINNIPPKMCSSSCIYCRLGCSVRAQTERQEFYPPGMVAAHVEEKIIATHRKGGKIDCLTFVSDSEHILDMHLGEEIERVKSSGISIAVSTNALLLWDKDLRDELTHTDWVSLCAGIVVVSEYYPRGACGVKINYLKANTCEIRE
jgi:wyosine [tRNA(Phe)-imidazoG37] synthetase (radical SAM superfamily)